MFYNKIKVIKQVIVLNISVMFNHCIVAGS